LDILIPFFGIAVPLSASEIIGNYNIPMSILFSRSIMLAFTILFCVCVYNQFCKKVEWLVTVLVCSLSVINLILCIKLLLLGYYSLIFLLVLLIILNTSINKVSVELGFKKTLLSSCIYYITRPTISFLICSYAIIHCSDTSWGTKGLVGNANSLNLNKKIANTLVSISLFIPSIILIFVFFILDSDNLVLFMYYVICWYLIAVIFSLLNTKKFFNKQLGKIPYKIHDLDKL